MIRLYDSQREAVGKLRTGSILCGDVGTGKSITAIVYYFCRVCGGMINGTKHGFSDDYVPMKTPRDLYIITTARKRDTFEWDKELLPFLIFRNNENGPYNGKMNLVIDSWNNIKKYTSVDKAFFIFDEDKVIGSGEWVKAFYKIAAKNDWILLTATPGDNWIDYIPIFVANGFYRNKTDFCNQHVVYSRYSKFPSVDRYIDQGRLLRLREKILVRMDAKKPAVQNHFTIDVLYDRQLYRMVTVQRWNPLKNAPIKNVSELRHLRRRIVNSDPSRIAELLRLLEGHPKAIIFYNFDYELEILRSADYLSGTIVSEWNGHKHEMIPTSERWVYLVQYISGCEGWNCVETDTVIFYSLNDSYKVMVQAAGRIDRMNTPFEQLYYYRLKSSAPIDLGISRALKNKKKFNETRFDNGRYDDLPLHNGSHEKHRL